MTTNPLQDACVSQLPELGETQPSMYAWSDWRGGCNGNKAIFPVDKTIDLNASGSKYGIGANDVDTIWVPPNVEVTVYPNWTNLSISPVKFDGTGHLGKDITYTGLFQMDTMDDSAKYIVDEKTGNRISLNDIDYIKSTITKPWETHLSECCSGVQTDKNQCGKYLPGSVKCSSYLLKCTGDTLKTDENCKAMCAADPKTCDKIKLPYCSKNPKDSYCSCIRVEEDKDYIAFKNTVVKKTGQGPRIGCSPFGKCNTGVDMIDIFLPASIIEDRKTPCDSFNSIVDQSITTAGSGNIVQTSQETGLNSDKNVNNQTPDTGMSTTTLLIILMFVLIVIGGVGGFLAMRKGKKKTDDEDSD